MLEDCPDSMSTLNFREILGGVSEGFVLRLIRSGKIKAFKIGGNYIIPKTSVINYLVSPNYQAIKHRLKKSF